MQVQLKADRSNHRTWKAALKLRLNATTPKANGLRLALMDVLEGNLDLPEYEEYQEDNEGAYDLELDQCEQLIKVILAQMVHESHMGGAV